VAAETFGRLLSASETVLFDTPARRAISETDGIITILLERWRSIVRQR